MIADAAAYGVAVALPIGAALLLWRFARSVRLGEPRAPSRGGNRRGRPGRGAQESPVRRARWRALLAGNALVLALLVSIVYLAGETYFRFMHDKPDSFGLSRSARRWFERHYRFNDAGVRDNLEYENAIAPGKRRISFVGDSFTAGHGVPEVDDRFINLIRARRGREWEIHGVAEDGLDTGEELETLKAAVANGYQLDVVVLVYCLNDIADIVPEWQSILARIYGRQQREGFLLRHSWFLNAMYYRWLGRRDPDIADYYGFVRRAYGSPLWERQKERLAALQAFCESRGARLLAVTFPFLHALGPEYPYARVHDGLDRFWLGRGVAHLDLRGVYEGYAPDDLTVSGADAHPNPRAHAMAAGAIEAFVASNLAVRGAGGAAGASPP